MNRKVIPHLIILIFTIFLSFFFIITKSKIKYNQAASAATNSIQVSFQPTNENILNPERGLYYRTGLHGTNNYNSVRDKGHSLTHSYIRLDNFRYSDISQAFLDDLDAGFQRLREAGVKGVIRFSYNHGKNPDAPKQSIMRHLDQVKPILEKNVDVISSMEAGFIGAWGEWHHSTHGLDNYPDRKDILFKALDTLPDDRMVLIRRAKFRMGIYGRKMEASEAFTGSRIARTGYHNDGILNADGGAYKGNEFNETTEYWKSWVAHETQFVANGGETSFVSVESHCNRAPGEMSRVHFTHLNSGWRKEVLDILKAEGCFDEIVKHLGYRFVLDNLQVSSSVQPGGKMDFRLNLHNEGYAAMFNQRPLFLVLENRTNGYKKTIPLKSNSNPHSTDPRRWLPGNTITINEQITISNDVPGGTYNLYFWLPDYYQNLRDIPEYSIRMANQNIWQVNTGYNLLTNNLQVGSGPPISPTPTSQPGIPGDANDDGVVDTADYVIWLNNYNQSRQGSQYGDFNSSGKVDGVDYIIWLSNFGN
jgi:hypothetical protein